MNNFAGGIFVSGSYLNGRLKLAIRGGGVFHTVSDHRKIGLHIWTLFRGVKGTMCENGLQALSRGGKDQRASGYDAEE